MNRQFFLHTLVFRNVYSRIFPSFQSFRFIAALLIAVGLMAAPSQGFAQSPPPPPAPSDTSTVGQTVTNPLTSETTTVISLQEDPPGSPTAGDTAFVQTADGFAFLVKDIGEFIYNNDTPPLAFEIVGPGATPGTVLLSADPPDGPTAELRTGLPDVELQAEFNSEDEPGAITPPISIVEPDGVSEIETGQDGTKGRNGALVVPPRKGGDGRTGPAAIVDNFENVDTAENFGILAISQGGDGGKGGNSYLSFWNGRDGGNGGKGGRVDVTNNAGIQVQTSRNGRHGIFALSRSGKAGDGGTGFAAPGGGTGGKSADGGSVTVNNLGDVITLGRGAFGIYGMSVSNNGGNGGDQWGLVGEAGDGGFGGSGGSVSITNGSSGTINTSGEYAHGIFAQSVGGSGGSAGTSGNLLLSLLGSADNGGNGSTVDVINDGEIVTTGDFSRGMFAQSIGGGGGSGGTAAGLISIGGAGAGGGSAGRVEGVNNASGGISTSGKGSDGIFVQSVGGSGGAASGAGGLIAIGGSGGEAGSGGEVVARNFGSIATRGDGARGIVAQSIGGGGGDGGNAGALIAVGGRAGKGGDGGIVRVTQGGRITTAGDDATAIFSQSVGGGGGSGGSGGSGNSGGPFASVAIGGSGGEGGDGGDVVVTLQGISDSAASVIRTEGDRANGLFAQSVGGGGGNGGGSVAISAGVFGALSVSVGGRGGLGGDGGRVTMSPGSGGVSVIETVGDDASAVVLQSIGGGGGNGGYAISAAGSLGIGASASVSVGVGGTGGFGGRGDKVLVGRFASGDRLIEAGLNGSILTTGNRSTGLLAQSVGGGGGNGGQSVSVAAAGSDGAAVALSAGIGGRGALGGTGDDVLVGTQGNVTTEGDASTGVLVQSIGGGGGNGGGSITGSLAGAGAAAGSVSIGVGGRAGGGNAGGDVVLAMLEGTVTTGGESSTGIIAQSIGGGGGNGGYAVAVGAAGAGVGAGAVSIGLGGTGGTGGAGGSVRANLESDVDTSGDHSTGVLVQSVGGGGGNGGFSVAAGVAGAGTGAGTVGVGLGGRGGPGSRGGRVDASSAGTITTRGDNSSGFVAQSVGGGGGNGGFNVTGTVAGGGTGSGAVSVGLGGVGGSGTRGGEVTASTSGDVSTEGDRSSGIVAQSVGGGGGNGGFNVSVALSGAGTGSGAVGVGLGGRGGAGSDASTVDLTVDNNVVTMGEDSTAVVAQSVGGGGGNGGFNVSVSGSGAGTGSVAVGVGLGGSGSSGGDGGFVESIVRGDLMTLGDNSNGLLAQSVGGGGGNGGFNVSAGISVGGTGSGTVGVGIGGSGAGGGDGGNVESSLTGNVVTEGEAASGIVAQSLGGGGGNGAFNVTGAIDGSGTVGGAISVGIGGAGGAGGSSGTVTNTVTGNVFTAGDAADGVLAQSLGGGGGNGGFNVAGAISVSGGTSGAVAVGIGGSGGSGGGSDAVTNTVTGEVGTSGSDSFGIVTQSIGGGGGNGAFNISGSVTATTDGSGNVGVGIGGSGGSGGDAGTADTTLVGDVTTTGEGAGGVMTQSLGGGGGNGGFNVTGTVTITGGVGGTVGVGVGGSGDSAGNAVAATSSVTGDVVTVGSDAVGITTQSVGGGGGNGGFNVTGSLSATSSAGGNIGVGVGGSGGGGGNAGAADSTLVGNVTTLGDGAGGVLTQSLGGGGGNGGFNVTAGLTVSGSGAGTVGVGVGGSGDGGGTSDSVSTTVTGDVMTAGKDATAIVSQSIGGGGGNGAFNVTGTLSATSSGSGNLGVGIGGSGSGGGNAGSAGANVTGNIIAEGNNSGGLLVQSLGGGGGNGGFNVTAGVTIAKSGAGTVGVGVGGFGGGAGNSGIVDGTFAGSITTSGDDSYGALLQSLGGGGGNGGLNVTAGAAIAKRGAGTIGVGVGGFGGGGGDAATVTGTITGDVLTTGSDAFGVMAQSLGGGGGNGGLNVTGAMNFSRQTSGSVALGIGGFGGGAGDGSDVMLTRSGLTRTMGSGADGVVAQSIGGGGGNGGLNVSGAIAGSSSGGTALSAALGLGGFGAGGGDAGNVMANVSGDVIATGIESETTETIDGLERRVISGGSNGILAQSVGGSGGNGGLNVSAGIAFTSGGSSGSGVTLGVGGFGGTGGDAGNVGLEVTADDVVSIGDSRAAVVAQSVGGGGGNGGINVSAGIVSDAAVTVGVGGSGGGGGKAGNVNATVAVGQVSARGEAARGVVAQSVGGGGGNGGINISGGLQVSRSTSLPSVVFGMGGAGGAGNESGNVDLTQSGAVVVDGVNSIGVLAQSVAGGGGNGALNVSGSLAAGQGFAGVVGVGGSGGLGADAGGVTLNSDGAIDVSGVALAELDEAGDDFTRFGDRANGILAQSIGGGGGNGGVNISGVATRGDPIALNVGASGGGGGNAGAVSVTRGAANAALLRTRGDQANGLTAQSIGGGGGNAGMNLQFAFNRPVMDEQPVSAMITIGGAGGDPGHGAATTVNQTGDIVTDGRQSAGILAQSVGGGGGNANFNVAAGFNKKSTAFSLAIGGAPGDGGDGGTVEVTHGGDIATLGDDSMAIFAQSIGGGGGNTALNMARSLGSSSALSIAIGRTGGTGGIGGDVTVESDGTLTTAGDRAAAVLAQSVGNAGGKSGATSVGFATQSGEGQSARKASVNVAVGLEGGSGGRAGDVDVSTGGVLMTEGLEAHGIHAQSVGGGGGIGGAASNMVTRETTSVRIGVGGSGGDGGVAGQVSVDNEATIVTDGGAAHGVYAQSIGGGGGTGGYSGQLAIQAGGAAGNGNNSIGVSVGGTGGTGAASDAVSVANRGVIVTGGDESTGISAQSFGGGGGDGGIVVNGAISGSGRNNAMTVGIGGAGGTGGVSGNVDVVNEGTIVTSGRAAAGIRAQSIAGGGGNAGLVSNLDISRETGSRASRTVTMNIGGEGGDGAVAGDVAVSNRSASDGSGGVIVTEGDDSYGILAQSIGGGGGNGSSIVSGRFVQDNNTTGRNATLVSLNVGGFGGDGGVAGNVTVDNDALIDTTGENAHGVFAQSIGGGGGNGGVVLAVRQVIGSAKKASGSGTSTSSDRMLSVGGVGGNGGDAGTVLVNNSGQIVTRGENAHGVFAQSIGGGGGNTGWVQGGNSNKFVAGAVKKLVGALGGEGGLGGEVTVNHSGDISVFGDGAQAIKADSINGGGGTTISKFETVAGIFGADLPEIPGIGDILPFEEIPVLELRIGGEQQQDTNAGNVTLNNTGTFGVFGDNGAGNGSMAVGGGGGSATVDVNLGLAEATDEEIAAIDVDVELGGLDGQNNAGGDLDSRHDGDILSMGQNSHGVALQSVGGGGGRANYAFSGDSTLLGELSYRLGGSNGSNESGGLIDHAQNGNVVTEGDLSHGLFVSSVGGGGGSLSLAFDFDEPDPATAATADANAPQQLAAFLGATGITLGSNGGSLLNGGDVALNHNGGIATTGELSSGLILQSIGSGGGEARVQGAENLTVTLGGSNGASGDGGDIDLFVRDGINTAGSRSHGVLLQSIGGGGGAVFTDRAPASVLFSTDNSGDGGAIAAVFLRDIVTQGDGANGVIAQSLGGGGGFVDGAFFGSAGGTGAGDSIDLEIAGDIFAMGTGSNAVLAQSLGSSGGGDIRVSLSANRTLLGGTGGAAVIMDGGAENTVINRGLITTMDGIDGLAIRAGAGNDRIINEGELVGSLDLGDGSNAVDNASDALFESGAAVDLGNAGSLLTNAGTIAPGGRNLAQATALNGSFVQTESGVFESELDFLSDSLDALTATGSVDTAGDVILSLLNTQAILPGEFTRTLFGSETGYTNSGINFVTAPSVVVSYDLLESADALDLSYAVDFSPTGLGDNRTSTGDYFNRVQLAGSTDELADTVIRLVAIGDLEQYRDVMTQLGPEIYAEQQAQTLAGAQSFLRNVRERCTVGDAYSNEDEDECLWLRYDVQDMDRDGGLGSPELEGDGRRYAFGWQYRRPDDSVFGVGFALDDTDFSGFGERWVARGTSWQLSAIGELPMRNNQAMVLQAALGQSSYETQRLIDVTQSYLAQADNDVVFLSGLIGFLDRREVGRYRFESGVDFGYAYLKGSSLSEIGAAEQSLMVDGRSDNYFWVTPSVEVSTGSLFANDVNWEVFGRVGVQHYISDPNTTSIGRLAGGPVGVAGMGNAADLDRTHGIFGVGLRATSGNLRFSLSYEADESSNRSASGVNGKLIFTF